MNKKDKKDMLENFFNLQNDFFETKKGKTILGYLDDIDTKVGALLTHVSIMLAVATIIFQQIKFEHSWIKLAAGLEVIGYIFITLWCITCINIISPDSKFKSAEDYYEHSLNTVKYRHFAYKFCYKATILLTIVLGCIFVVHLLE